MKVLICFFFCQILAVAAPPANDNFASRTVVTGASYTVTTTNAEATTQTNENTFDDAIGATIWWQWTAPSAGWVKFDTIGSEIDTVMRVTSTMGLAGTLFGFNDEAEDEAGVSSLTFQVTSGQVLYIAVGGYDFGDGAEEGVVQFTISTGLAVRPEVWIANVNSSSFSPATVNVTNSAQSSVYAVTVAGVAGARGTIEDFFLQYMNGGYSNVIGVPSLGYIIDSQAATVSIPLPRYIQGGAMRPVFTLVTEEGDFYEWGNASSGAPYLVPMPSLTVTNAGEVDSTSPSISNFSISSRTANVNASAVNLNVSMTLTDTLSGVGQVQVQLVHPAAEIIRPVAMTRTAGSVTNGTWTGVLNVPLEFPAAEYELIVELYDQARNYNDYASFGSSALPGGDVLINVVGGGSYWLWAYEMMANDSLVGMSLDPNGDGIDNLTCFAYGLDPLDEIERSDLPEVVLANSGLLEMSYYRRKVAAGLSYIPQFSDDLVTWSDFSGTESVEDFDDDWSIHTLTDFASSRGKTRRYARMKLTYIDP